MKRLLTCAALLSAIAVFAEGYRIDFTKANFDFDEGLPKKWELRGKSFTDEPEYSIVKDSTTGKEVLRIHCVKATGAILFKGKTDLLKKYPVVRWKWRMVQYPTGADARHASKDDQGIALYAGFGTFSSKSVAYEWNTETPKDISDSSVTYGGVVSVKWFSIRNKTDGTDWKVEQRNILKDLEEAYGSVPDKTTISISSNSQYTGTESIAEIEYIEFLPESADAKK